jgi:hypothetical protein
MELAALGATIASAASAAAPYALAAGTALTATSQVLQGREQSKAAQFEAEQLRIQEQQFRTQAAQEEARRREQLTENLETIQAIRSGRGVGLTSPGGTAQLADVTSDEERDIAIAKSNLLTRADLSRRMGILSEKRASTSLLAGYLGAAGTVAGGISKYGYFYGDKPVPASRGLRGLY